MTYTSYVPSANAFPTMLTPWPAFELTGVATGAATPTTGQLWPR